MSAQRVPLQAHQRAGRNKHAGKDYEHDQRIDDSVEEQAEFEPYDIKGSQKRWREGTEQAKCGTHCECAPKHGWCIPPEERNDYRHNSEDDAGGAIGRGCYFLARHLLMEVARHVGSP